jgi:hypothetical protein
MGKIVSVYEHFGSLTAPRNELSSWTEAPLYCNSLAFILRLLRRVAGDLRKSLIFNLWLCSPARAMASFLSFLDHTRRATVGMDPLDEWSACRRNLYLTHTQQTKHLCPGGIRTHDRSRRAAVDLRPRPRGILWGRPPVGKRYARNVCGVMPLQSVSKESIEIVFRNRSMSQTVNDGSTESDYSSLQYVRIDFLWFQIFNVFHCLSFVMYDFCWFEVPLLHHLQTAKGLSRRTSMGIVYYVPALCSSCYAHC